MAQPRELLDYPGQPGSAREEPFLGRVFHISTTIVLVIGVVLLWRGWDQPGRATGNLAALGGLALMGWGAFHVVDQVVFRELLNVHNIRENVDNVALYNWGFMVIGLVLAAGCWLLRSKGRIGTTEQTRH